MSEMQQFEMLEDQIRETVRVPDANPEFVAHLRGKLARASLPVKKPAFGFRPAWAFGLLAAVLLFAAAVPGVADAVRQVFGFVPGLGLVEQSSPLKVSEAPVVVTREGVTLTLEQVVAYADRVELAYRVEGIPAETAGGSGPVCSGEDMYPTLGLADGARIQAKPMALGGERLAAGYTAGHSFPVALPEDTNSATFLLKCLQETRRGAAPEDWAVTFNLAPVPQGEKIGDLLKEGNPPQVVQPAEIDASFSFLGGAAKENGYHFFFRFTAQNDSPDFLAVRPSSMYLIDSRGERIELINALPWSPFDHVDVWEYRAVDIPAAGPVTLFVDGVQVYTLAQSASFVFTPGKDAQVGQTWHLDEHFNIGGHDLSVTSATMIEVEQHKGFSFVVEAGQPGTKISVELMDVTQNDPRYSMWSPTGDTLPAQSVKAGFVYESAVPETLRVTFNTIHVPVKGSWKVEWTPPARK